MGLFDKFKKGKSISDNIQGVVPFEDLNLIMKTHLVDGIYMVGLPIGWNVYESDRFRAKTEDGKTEISITNWSIDNPRSNEEELKSSVLPLYDKFVVEGGYEPYDDFVFNDNKISKSFKVDDETQYYLTTINVIGEQNILTQFIIRDIGSYDPQMRAILAIIVSTMQFK